MLPLIILLSVSCGELPAPSPGGADKLSIEAIADGSVAHQSWTPEETIAIFRDGAPVEFVITSFGGASSIFRGDLSSGSSELTALFPYSGEAVLADGIIGTEIPALQKAGVNAPYVPAAVSIAHTSGGGLLLFKAAYAMVTVPVKAADRIVRVMVQGLDGEALAGPVKVEVSQSPEAVAEGGSGVSIVPADGETFPSGRFTAIVAPVSLERGYRLTLQNVYGSESAVEVYSRESLRRGQTLDVKDNVFDDLVWREGNLSVGGTVISPTNNLYGLISDTSTGKGIPGVAVTDGFHFTVTDSNGVYQMSMAEGARKVYYSLPAGYSPALDEKFHRPLFYSEADLRPGNVNRQDFTLSPSPVKDDKFTLLLIGDPQVQTSAQLSRFRTETVADIISTLNTYQEAGRYENVVALALGDMGYDNNAIWPNLKTASSNVLLNSGYLPIYQLMGNHDKDSLSDSDPDGLFINTFGPKDYSLNIGKMHLVVMDNVREDTREAHSSYPNKYRWTYGSGLTAAQLQWLKEDLALVENPQEKLVVFAAHIPIKSTAMERDVLPLLTPFREAHIMTAHTHYPHNIIHDGYTAAGGQKVYEHIHGAACGTFWHSNLCGDGQPQGYSLYEIEGAGIKNWVAKGTGQDLSLQMRVYDGNDTYHGAYTYKWYEVALMGTSTSVYVKGNSHLRYSFVASVWNDDTENWKLEMYRGGVKVGDFTRLAPGEACDVCTTSFFSNLGYKSNYYNVSVPGHIWYYTPASGDPSSETGWEVVATQTIPGSGEVNVYRANTLQKDFTGFAATR